MHIQMQLVSKLVVDIREDPEEELRVVIDLEENNLTEDKLRAATDQEDTLTEDTKRDAVQDKRDPIVNLLVEDQEEEEVIEEIEDMGASTTMSHKEDHGLECSNLENIKFIKLYSIYKNKSSIILFKL